jgi:hypothetical protein
MIMGSQVGVLRDPHIHLYPHITSSTDHCSFPYLANFISMVSGVGTIELSCRLFRDIHISPKTFMIYNSTSDSSNSQASLYPGSKKFQSIYHYLPSAPPSHPSQCTLIILLLVKNQHTGTKQLALTTKKLEEISH